MSQIKKPEKKDIYRQAIELWGSEFPLDMLAEECLECSLAVHRFKRRKENSFTDLMSEMADVEIMLKQIKVLLCFGGDKYAFRTEKVKKLKGFKERIKQSQKE